MKMILNNNDSNKSSFYESEENLSTQNEELTVMNCDQRIRKNFVNISKYDKRVIVFSIILIIIAIIIVIVPHFFGAHYLRPATHITVTTLFCMLAIVSGYVIGTFTSLRGKLVAALISLLIYGIFCSVCVSIFFEYASLVQVIHAWITTVVLCGCGVTLGVLITKDLTEKLDAILVVCVVIFVLTSIVVVVLIFFKKTVAIFIISAIGMFIELFLATVILGQMVFKSGQLHIRDDWSMGVLIMFTLVITTFVIAQVLST
uniref:Uncharacterized protein n=1 Tax=Trichobilharzia regenti TaxID=157069 RepID=A0AA85KDV4_TRIRE|nr:unnamed protein product [Trichobilharzia regenti]